MCSHLGFYEKGRYDFGVLATAMVPFTVEGRQFSGTLLTDKARSKYSWRVYPNLSGAKQRFLIPTQLHECVTDPHSEERAAIAAAAKLPFEYSCPSPLFAQGRQFLEQALKCTSL